MKNKHQQLILKCDQFISLAELQYKKALSPTLQKLDEIVNPSIDDMESALGAINYVSSLAGSIPTPIGNPFSLVAFSDEMDKGNYFSGILYLLTAVPDLGALAGSLKSFPTILKGVQWLVKSQTIPTGLKRKIVGLIVGYFQSTSWIESFRTVCKSIFLNCTPAPYLLDKLKSYAKKAAVEAVEDINQLASNICDKVIKDLQAYMNNCASQISYLHSSIA